MINSKNLQLLNSKTKIKKKHWEKLNLKIKKNCLEVAQFENKINHPEKNKIYLESLKADHKRIHKKQ